MSESKEQLRFRIFAMTHKSPTQAADEWLADKERIHQLEKELTECDGYNCCPLAPRLTQLESKNAALRGMPNE